MNQLNLYHDQQYVILHQFFVLNANVMINYVNVKILEVLMHVLYIVQFLSIMLIEQFLINLNQIYQHLFNKKFELFLKKQFIYLPCKRRITIKTVINLHGQLLGERNRAPRFKNVSVVPLLV